MNIFKKVTPEQLNVNFFNSIGKGWALACASKSDGSFNFMTVSWGGVGIMWNKPVAFIFIRPQRYTYEFAEAGDEITLSFLPEKHRDIMKFCGSKSGRDFDKVAEFKIPVAGVENSAAKYSANADLVLVARKLYADTLKKEAFFDKAMLDFYKAEDYHKMYICEITEALVKID